MTTKTLEPLKDEQLVKKLILGGLVGAALGVAATYILVNLEETKSLSAGWRRGQNRVATTSIKPNEVLKLGVSLVTVTRQIADLINKM